MQKTIATLAVLASLAAIGCGSAEPSNDEGSESLGKVSEAAVTNCPGFSTTQVCVCSGTAFTGTCSILDLNNRFYPSLSESSIAVGSNVKVRWCTSTGFEGGCTSLGAGGTNGNAVGRGLAPLISSLRIDPVAMNCFVPGIGNASIFVDTNWGGDCTVIYRGNYPSPRAVPDGTGHNGSFGLANDQISSVIVGGLTSINLWRDTNFGPPGGPNNIFGLANFATTVQLVPNFVQPGINFNDTTSLDPSFLAVDEASGAVTLTRATSASYRFR